MGHRPMGQGYRDGIQKGLAGRQAVRKSSGSRQDSGQDLKRCVGLRTWRNGTIRALALSTDAEHTSSWPGLAFEPITADWHWGILQLGFLKGRC